MSGKRRKFAPEFRAQAWMHRANWCDGRDDMGADGLPPGKMVIAEFPMTPKRKPSARPMVQETAMHENPCTRTTVERDPLSLVGDLSPVPDRQSRNRECTHQRDLSGGGRGGALLRLVSFWLSGKRSVTRWALRRVMLALAPSSLRCNSFRSLARRSRSASRCSF